MLKRVVQSLGLVEHTDRDPGKKTQPRGTKTSPKFGSPSKHDIFVKIVFEGGKNKKIPHALRASELMEKYPGMCVARPEVFQAPHQSVLWPEEYLSPGQKYYMMLSRQVEKLKRKHPEEGKTKRPNGAIQEVSDTKITKSPNGHTVKENGRIKVPNGVSQEIMDAKTTVSPGKSKIKENGKVKEANGVGKNMLGTTMNQSLAGETGEEFTCSANDYFVSNDKWKRNLKRRGIKGKKPFVPPLPKAIAYRGLAWQPSLPSVQELSP